MSEPGRGPRRVRAAAQLSYASRKPEGLWTSPGSEWLSFCRTRGWYERSSQVTAVALDDDRHLQVRSAADLTRLDEEYGENEDASGQWRVIDWSRVAERWGGVVISPLVRRHESRWYDSWDVACACTWSPDAAIVCAEVSDSLTDELASAARAARERLTVRSGAA